MGEGFYRDGSLGMRARVAAQALEVAELHARLTPAFWERMPVDVAERLRALRCGAPADNADQAELARSEAALDAYRSALEQAIVQVPTVLADLVALPDAAPTPGLDLPGWAVFFGTPRAPTWGNVPTKEEVRALGAGLHKALGGSRYEGVSFETVGLTTLAHFRSRGAPFAIGTAPAFNSDGHKEGAQVALATSVAQATPRLLLRAETWGDDVLKSIGLRSEMELGDMTFDGLFLVQGDPAARGLLTAETRAGLVFLAKYDVPRLVVEHGEARLHWRWEPDAVMIDAAVQVLAAIRKAPAQVAMLR
jgi:hypothetical protein